MVGSNRLAYAKGLGKQPCGHPARVDEDRAQLGGAYRGKAEAEMVRLAMTMAVKPDRGGKPQGV